VFNVERAKPFCASEPRQHRIQQRALEQRCAWTHLEAETEQCQELERRKEQQHIEPSTACCILLSAIKFKWRVREDYSHLVVQSCFLHPHLWERVDLWTRPKWHLNQDQARLVRAERVVRDARARVVRRAAVGN
jgi:hypothetical protein